jgi:hypothetical protein
MSKNQFIFIVCNYLSEYNKLIAPFEVYLLTMFRSNDFKAPGSFLLNNC